MVLLPSGMLYSQKLKTWTLFILLRYLRLLHDKKHFVNKGTVPVNIQFRWHETYPELITVFAQNEQIIQQGDVNYII